MSRPRILSSQKQKYCHQIFYYPRKPDYELVWSYFENLLAEASNPNSRRFNPKLRKGTVMRRLIMKYITETIDKRRGEGPLDEISQEVYEAIRRIIQEEDRRIAKVMDKRKSGH
ncbi:hypothetical protein COV15_01415 [Candidatus Woesearchaeota archaeon CG10_big_fil_rev_8_21_14_0_10_34_12]|nr:MAG: hypothetical protein COV15_01415 [Candidatus Woesearchaeota archaeon CG10_big_fil_rev_8_21_14_0_10_34_12]